MPGDMAPPLDTYLSNVSVALEKAHWDSAIEIVNAALSKEHISKNKKMASVFFLHRASAHKGKGACLHAIADCSHAIALDQTSIQAYSQRANLNEFIQDSLSAKSDLQILTKLYRQKLLSEGNKETARKLQDCTSRLCKISQDIKRGIIPNPFLILNSKSGDSAEKIRKSYLKLSMNFHPDKVKLLPDPNGLLWKEIGEEVKETHKRMFQLINNANEFIQQHNNQMQLERERNKLNRNSTARNAYMNKSIFGDAYNNAFKNAYRSLNRFKNSDAYKNMHKYMHTDTNKNTNTNTDTNTNTNTNTNTYSSMNFNKNDASSSASSSSSPSFNHSFSSTSAFDSSPSSQQYRFEDCNNNNKDNYDDKNNNKNNQNNSYPHSHSHSHSHSHHCLCSQSRFNEKAQQQKNQNQNQNQNQSLDQNQNKTQTQNQSKNENQNQNLNQNQNQNQCHGSTSGSEEPGFFPRWVRSLFSK